VESAQKNGYYEVYGKKRCISDNLSVESISDKRLKIQVQLAQTNGVETRKGIVRNLKRISKISMLPLPGKISADPNAVILNCLAHGPL